MILKSIEEVDFSALTNRSYTPSPAAWEDEVLYFLMLDRFSDNKETNYLDIDGNLVNTGSTPRFTPADNGNAIQNEASAAQWRDAGQAWVGGTLKGLQSKLGYLKRLGITAVWISPIFKQVKFHETYHGYGIQDFLQVDEHFGTRDDLRELVDAAHQAGIRIILDIILNHTGDVFAYADSRPMPPWYGGSYPVIGYKNAFGDPNIPFQKIDSNHPGATWPNDAVWPAEFSEPSTFTQKGKINSWDYYPEYLEGDFENLKDVHLGFGETDSYQPSPALLNLCKAYQFWIAYADIDGFRVDTVKHMDKGATRIFASSIHEFAQSIGKENFYLIGEITGGRVNAFETMKTTGLDAALGISDIPDLVEYLPKGYKNPNDYFRLFRNSILVGEASHTWFKNHVVTVMDDHDQVRKGNSKARFAASDADALVAALGMQLTTLGIPCIYYGTEQAFDGEGGNDRYLREAMFGGEFGAFRSRNRHCFDEDTPVFREVSKILNIRRAPVNICLRRGRQYLRQISGNGQDFGYPEMLGGQLRSIVPWSRIFNNREMLCAINTDLHQPKTAWNYVDSGLNKPGSHFECIYSTDPGQIGQQLPISSHTNGGLITQLTLSPAAFAIFAQR